jgi:hypothetical protein
LLRLQAATVSIATMKEMLKLCVSGAEVKWALVE